MNRISLMLSLVASVVLVEGTALAQLGQPEEVPVDPDANDNPLGQPTDDTTTPPPEEEPVDMDSPAQPEDTTTDMRATQPEAPPTEPAMADGDGDEGDRPDAIAIGPGIGYTFPSDLDRIDTTSVRIRFISGFTIEPIVEISTTQTGMEFGGARTDDGQFDIRLGTNMRFPVASKGSFDFTIVAGVGVTFQTIDPDGTDNNTTNTNFGASWGFGIDWWLSPRWLVGVTASNPLLNIQLSNQNMVGGDLQSSNITIGAIFDPTISLMGHLFF